MRRFEKPSSDTLTRLVGRNSRHDTVRRPVLEDQIAGGSAFTPTADHARMAQSRLTRRSWVAYAFVFKSVGPFFLLRQSISSSRSTAATATLSRTLAFSNGDSARWDGLGSAHDKNLGRETHSTICDVLTKRFERLTLHFRHLIV